MPTYAFASLISQCDIRRDSLCSPLSVFHLSAGGVERTWTSEPPFRTNCLLSKEVHLPILPPLHLNACSTESHSGVQEWFDPHSIVYWDLFHSRRTTSAFYAVLLMQIGLNDWARTSLNQSHNLAHNYSATFNIKFGGENRTRTCKGLNTTNRFSRPALLPTQPSLQLKWVRSVGLATNIFLLWRMFLNILNLTWFAAQTPYSTTICPFASHFHFHDKCILNCLNYIRWWSLQGSHLVRRFFRPLCALATTRLHKWWR